MCVCVRERDVEVALGCTVLNQDVSGQSSKCRVLKIRKNLATAIDRNM